MFCSDAENSFTFCLDANCLPVEHQLKPLFGHDDLGTIGSHELDDNRSIDSSGMNAKGLALADTQVAVATHRVGWVRYFLMTRLLATCSTVAEACAFIKSTTHAGGGTLVLADVSGNTAVVELGASGPVIRTGPVVWRTNHYETPELAGDSLYPDGDRIAAYSRARFACLEHNLANQGWRAEDAARLMATHATDPRPFAGPLCQHQETDACQTFSSAVYSCRVSSLMFSDGNPCAGKWRTFQVLT